MPVRQLANHCYDTVAMLVPNVKQQHLQSTDLKQA